MGKLARELSADDDENQAPPEERRTVRMEEWQLQDTGDMINTKTGEIMDPEDLARLAGSTATEGEDANPFDDDYSQVPRRRK